MDVTLAAVLAKPEREITMPQQQPPTDERTLQYHKCQGDPKLYDFDKVTPTYFVKEQTQESLCGLDGRTKVTATTALPYKAICKLHMKAANGANLIGTGWLSHKNKLYTAGHCVYDPKYGGWMASIIVIPGLVGTGEPYGRYTASNLLATDGWIQSGSERFDMGAIKLLRSVRKYEALTPKLADASEVTVCGYPGDRDGGIFQYKMRDAIRKANGQFRYLIDTFGGQSGAPLLQDNSSAIGIHNYGGCDNRASDLYPEFIEAIDSW